MKLGLSVAAIVLLAGMPAPAHRLDEYLQGAIISVEKNRIDAQITLTPGVAVFPMLLAEFDTDGNGVISAVEQQAYADRVLRDLTLGIDGQPLKPQLLSTEFPAIDEMKAGRGQIRIDFSAKLPRGGPDRKLVFENHHQRGIAAYQVNCLVPRDPDIRILAQNRNYSQSFYELDFVQAGAGFGLLSVTWLPSVEQPAGVAALLVAAGLTLLWRRLMRPSRTTDPR